MTLSATLAFLAHLWGGQEQQAAQDVGDIFDSWRNYLRDDPSRALDGDLPYRADLARIIAQGVLSATGGVLDVSAREAGLSSADPGVFSILGDYYDLYGPVLAEGVAAGTQDAAHRALRSGIRAGLSEREIAERLLPQVVPAAQARLRTIARTELTNAATLARVSVFAQAGVTRFHFNNVLDDRSTRTCRTCDEFVLDLTRPLHRDLCPACHYRCRSVLVPAEADTPATPDDTVRRALAVRDEEFPGWIPRLSPYLARIQEIS